MSEKITSAQREMLRLAIADKQFGGNPLAQYGIRQMAGGAKRRMFDAMKSNGWFDEGNCITNDGREAYARSAKPRATGSLSLNSDGTMTIRLRSHGGFDLRKLRGLL